MNEFLNLLQWMLENPLQGFALLFTEYMILAALYGQKRFRTLARIGAPFFLVQDWIVNLAFMSAIMLDPPGSPLEFVTGRMKRYKQKYAIATYNPLEAWRYGFAVLLCRALNRFDPGHC